LQGAEPWTGNTHTKEEDISGRTESIWQFSSEMLQTWGSYYTRSHEKMTEMNQNIFFAFLDPSKYTFFRSFQKLHSPNLATSVKSSKTFEKVNFFYFLRGELL
jgi:hypothetical protein